MNRIFKKLRFSLRWTRSPLLHFFLIGGLLFGAREELKRFEFQSTEQARQELVIPSEQVKALQKDWKNQFGRDPSEAELRTAIDQYVEEEVLFRKAKKLGLHQNHSGIRHRLIQIAGFISDQPGQSEEALYQMALRLGLDQTDLVVRRQMVTQMRMLAEKLFTQDQELPITEAEMQKYLRQHVDQFRQKDRVRFTHIFFNGDKRGSKAKRDAEQILKKLKEEAIQPQFSTQWGDPYLLGHTFPWLSYEGLAGKMGASFAKILWRKEPGQWSGPIPSTYGWHLVWVTGRREGQTTALHEVRNQVYQALLRERRKTRLVRALGLWRQEYVVRVEGMPGRKNES